MRFGWLCILALTFVVSAFPEIKRVWGTGEGIVGSDESQDQVESAIFVKAETDAQDSIGIYVESSIVTEKTENANGMSEITRETMQEFAGGLLKLVEGTKTIDKEFKDSTHQALSIRIRAQFEIDVDEYKKSLEAFASEGQEKTDIKQKAEAFGNAEREVTELSESDQMDTAKLASVLSDYKQAQDGISDAIVQLNGGFVLGAIAKKQDDRASNIKAYLTNIANLGGPNSIWNVKIIGQPEIEQVAGDKIQVTAIIDVTENDKAIKILKDNYKSYQTYLYPDGNPDYLTANLTRILWFPLALCFVDGDGKIIAASRFEGNGESSGLSAFLPLYKGSRLFEASERADFGLILNGSHFQSVSDTKIPFTVFVPTEIIKNTVSMKAAFVTKDINTVTEDPDLFNNLTVKMWDVNSPLGVGSFFTYQISGSLSSNLEMDRATFGNQISDQINLLGN